MFDKKLFQEKIEPRCAYCAKGVMPAGGRCSAFQYDPLKRVPPKPASLDTSRLDTADFRLD